MAAAAQLTLPASPGSQQQVPAIKIISDGSCDLVQKLDTAREAPASPTSMTKCKSLLNMKNLPKLALTQGADDAKCHQMMVFDEADQPKGHLSTAFESKFSCKQNFFVGSNNNLFFAQHAPGNMPRRLNRKCLSRINLNLYQQQPLVFQPPVGSKADSSKKMFKKAEQPKNNKVKATALNHSQTSNEIDSSCSLKPSKTSNLEAFNRMTKPYSSSSIMNLERVSPDTLTTLNSGAGAVPSSTSTNQILSPSHANDFVLSSNPFRKGSNMYVNFLGNESSSAGYGLGYLRSSNMNLYKSSTSLNALDLELLDSVSVGSFDRESIYSNYANSECELSNYCLYDPALQFIHVHPASQHHLLAAAKMAPVDDSECSSARESKLSSSMASLRVNSSTSTKTNSKVISWLQNI